MKALDLFCGAGGASMGMHQAGVDEIVGVDIKPMPEYPFHFVIHDVLALPSDFVRKFDFIWASPPCQAYSEATVKWRMGGKEYPDLISATRDMLLKSGKPFVIENVPPAPIHKDLLLCGEMFGLRVIKHRKFEVHGFPIEWIEHKKHRGTLSDGTYIASWTGGRPGLWGNERKRKEYKIPTIKQIQEAMGIDWITTRKLLAEAIPPAYSRYIFQQFKEKK